VRDVLGQRKSKENYSGNGRVDGDQRALARYECGAPPLDGELKETCIEIFSDPLSGVLLTH